jgi:hypothetical protein
MNEECDHRDHQEQVDDGADHWKEKVAESPQQESNEGQGKQNGILDGWEQNNAKLPHLPRPEQSSGGPDCSVRSRTCVGGIGNPLNEQYNTSVVINAAGGCYFELAAPRPAYLGVRWGARR